MTIPAPTYALKVKLNDGSGAWTYITADWLAKNGARWNRGQKQSDIRNFLADSGSLDFVMDNSERNSAGILGWYSPDNVNHRLGWEEKILVCLESTWGGIVHTEFIGRIADISPTPGADGPRDCHCTARDWFDEASNYTLTGLATMTNVRMNEVAAAIVAACPTQPPGGNNFDTGTDILPFALDTAVGAAPNPVTELASLITSEGGRGYLTGPGVFRIENRRARYGRTADFTLDGTHLLMAGATPPKKVSYNRIRVTSSQRALGQVGAVLWSQAQPQQINPGTNPPVSVTYLDPNQQASQVGAANMLPQVAGVDYVANTRADGTGTDLTSSVTITPTFGSTSAQLSVVLAGSVSGFLTTNKIRGTPVFTYSQTTTEASDAAAIAAKGPRDVTIDQPYQSNPANSAGMAAGWLAWWRDGRPVGFAVQIAADCSDYLRAVAFQRDLGSCVQINEVVTGGGKFFVDGIEKELRPGGNLFVTYYLGQSSDEGSYFTLDDSHLDSGPGLAAA